MSARMLRPSLSASQAVRCRATGSGPRSRSLTFAAGSKPVCLRSAFQAHLIPTLQFPTRNNATSRRVDLAIRSSRLDSFRRVVPVPPPVCESFPQWPVSLLVVLTAGRSTYHNTLPVQGVARARLSRQHHDVAGCSLFDRSRRLAPPSCQGGLDRWGGL